MTELSQETTATTGNLVGAMGRCPDPPVGGTMKRRSKRPRRSASPGTIRALRIAGWRYSSARAAWVHRAFNGTVGPVFIDPQYHQHPGVIDAVVFEAPHRRTPPVVVPKAERAPLPQRPIPMKSDRLVTPVLMSLTGTEPPRVLLVDGRPPVRGMPVPPPPAGRVVVPIKSARATG